MGRELQGPEVSPGSSGNSLSSQPVMCLFHPIPSSITATLTVPWPHHGILGHQASVKLFSSILNFSSASSPSHSPVFTSQCSMHPLKSFLQYLVAQWLCVCLWLSHDSGVLGWSPSSGSPQGACFFLCLPLPLSVSLMNK